MTLTTLQVKEARKFCLEIGTNPKRVQKELGRGFWEENCKGTFEGYLAHLADIDRYNKGGEAMKACLAASVARYKAGKSGAASL